MAEKTPLAMWNHSEVCILQLLTVATPISIGISILIVLKSTRNSTFPLKNRELLDQSREIYELLHIHHQNNVEETSIIELLRIRTNLIQKSSPVLRTPHPMNPMRNGHSKVSVITGFLRAFEVIPDQMWTISSG